VADPWGGWRVEATRPASTVPAAARRGEPRFVEIRPVSTIVPGGVRVRAKPRGTPRGSMVRRAPTKGVRRRETVSPVTMIHQAGCWVPKNREPSLLKVSRGYARTMGQVCCLVSFEGNLPKNGIKFLSRICQVDRLLVRIGDRRGVFRNRNRSLQRDDTSNSAVQGSKNP
jgi:hypothetical protein